MTPAEQHAAVLSGLAGLEQLATAAQPGGGWYREGRDVCTQMPLLQATDAHHDMHEDWVFTAATTADARHIAALQPAAVLAVLAGRRRILERHAPETRAAVMVGRPYEPFAVYGSEMRTTIWVCGAHRALREGLTALTPARWPCPDYLDAAADLLPDSPGHER